MSALATSAAPLTAKEVKELAAQWYRKLDVHAPLVELLPLVDEGAEMKFPEATLHGQADFEGWYERVIRIFFDEVHTLKEVKVQPTDEGAEVKVVVHWEASVWNPPAAKSQRIKLDAYQTWFVRRSPATDKPIIARYVVDELVYDKDSAKL
jgi:hypothetical protein